MTPEDTATTAAAAPKKAAKKKAVAKKKVAKKAVGGGRKSAFSSKKIIKLVRENPRRKGTEGFKSFAKITSGMSYEKYIAAGGRRQDLAFDLEHKYVKLGK